MIKAVLFRFGELLRSCAALSATAAGIFCLKNFITSVGNCTLVLGFMCLVFFAVNVRLMRRCFFELQSRLRFYLVNLIAYILFAAVGFGVYRHFGSTAYTWGFGITKIIAIANGYGVSTLRSAVIFHAVMAVVTVFSLLGMGWVLKEPMEIAEEFEDDIFDE